MNNIVNGKTMRNLTKRVKVSLVNDAKDYKKYVSKPSLLSQKIFKTLDKPIYVGFSILDLSKSLMYKFHYKYIGTKYDNCASFLFTDTDLVYKIKTDGVYEDFYENKNLFDFGDYPENSTFFDPVNNKVIAKMKDEVKGKISSEFVGLKSKMYSLVIVNNEEIIKIFCLIKN